MYSIVERVEKNQERILKLCECIIDLIDEVVLNVDLVDNFDWIKNEVKEIRDDINNIY
jgi:hypothetical protein